MGGVWLHMSYCSMHELKWKCSHAWDLAWGWERGRPVWRIEMQLGDPGKESLGGKAREANGAYEVDIENDCKRPNRWCNKHWLCRRGILQRKETSYR